MRLPSLCILSALLSGCAGTATESALRAPEGWSAPLALRVSSAPRALGVRRNAQPPLLYAADPANNTVWVVSQAGNHQAATSSITGLSTPESLAVDASGNLYVGNVSGGNANILEFAPGATSPSRTLSGVATPYAIAVDASGNVYADCIEDNVCTQNAISVFAAGATQPTSTLTDPNLGKIFHIALDAAGDLFVDGQTASFPVSADEIDEFPAGSSTPVVLGVAVNNPTALAVDAQQNLVVAAANGAYLSVFAPPYTGNPSKTYSFGCAAVGIAFNADASVLWYDCGTEAHQLSYPQFKKVGATKKLTPWSLAGLATSPPP